MVQQNDKRRKFIIVGAIVALLLVVGAVVLVNALGSNKQDPYKQVETTNTPDTSSTTPTDNTDKTPAKDDDKKDDASSDDTKLDPATVSTVNIDPMDLTVSYVKGGSGFEYFVLRTASGTQYVEFSSPELVGTKCTNDKGVFASIIESPSATESTTISKTTTVDGTKYGLSLADATCTKDPDLLKQFQSSFGDAFSLLKRIDA